MLCVPPAADGTVPASTLAAAALVGVTEVYRIGGAQAIAALAYGTETIRPVDVIVGPGNRYVALAKREVAGTVGIDSFAGPSEVVVVADGSVPAAFAAADLLAQAEHGPGGVGGARHLGPRRRRRHRRRPRRPARRRAPPRRDHRRPSPPAAASCWSTTPSPRSTRSTRSRPSTSSSSPPIPTSLAAAGAQRRRGVPRAVGAGRARRLRRGRQPRAAHRPHRPVRERAPGRHVPQARARRRRHRRRPRRARAPPPRPRRGRGPRRARALRRRPTRAHRPAGRARERRPVAPRDDLRALEGYHSPQLDVAVRLNTNESPFAPPAEFVDRWVEELRARAAQPLSRPRRARELRDALGAHLGQPRRAAVLRQRLQRGAADAAAHLRRPGPARRDVRAHVRAALAHRPHHRHRGGRGGAARRLLRRSRRRRARSSRSRRPRSCSCAAPTTRPARSSPRRPSRRCSPPTATTSSSSTRPTASSRRGARSSWCATTARSSSCAPTRRCGRWPRCGSASRWRRSGWSRSSRRSCCRTTWRRPPRSPAGSRSTSATEMDDRVQRLVAERERVAAELDRHRRHHRLPVGRQLPAVPPDGDGHERWEQTGRPGCAGARLLALAPPRRLPACHHRYARGERRLPRRAPHVAPGGALMSMIARRRTSEQHRTTKETTIELVLDVDGGGSASASTGIPFFDHMLEQLGKHGGFDLRIEATRRPRGRPPPHGGRRRHRARHRAQGGAGRQGGRASLRVVARAARRGAGAGGARPVGSAVPRVRGRSGVRVDRHVRPAARRGVLARVRVRRRDHAAHPVARREATATT